MSLPSGGKLELALLIALRDAGGEARALDLYPVLASHFSISDDDLRATHKNGANKWMKRVQFMKLALVHKGDVDQKQRGVWRITAQGRQRVPAGGPPPPPPTSSDEHRQLQTQIAEIGVLLGHHSSVEYKLDPYKCDVVWKRDQWQPSPGNVFEVQHHGSLEAALLKLKHAHDVCKPRLCLVVTGERDEKKVRQLVGPLFSGVFHEIRDETLILTAEQVAELHASLTKQSDMLKRLVGK